MSEFWWASLILLSAIDRVFNYSSVSNQMYLLHKNVSKNSMNLTLKINLIKNNIKSGFLLIFTILIP